MPISARATIPDLRRPALSVPQAGGEHEQAESAQDAEDVKRKQWKAGTHLPPGDRNLGKLTADGHETGRRRRHRCRAASPSL